MTIVYTLLQNIVDAARVLCSLQQFSSSYAHDAGKDDDVETSESLSVALASFANLDNGSFRRMGAR
jgi:hypothetical protein